MAKGQIETSIGPYLGDINNAVLGEEVRSSIHDAIEKIAQLTDSQLQEFDTVVTTAESIATTYSNTSTSVAAAKTEADRVVQKITDFDTAMSSLVAPDVVLGDYTYNANLKKWVPAASAVAYDSNLHKFTFTFPKGAYFRSDPSVYISNEADSASAEYNPKDGSFTIVLPNLIRQALSGMTVNITNIVPNANDQYLVDGEPVTPQGSYDVERNVLSLSLFQGLNGTGAERAFNAINKRPFFMRDLYVTDPSIFLVNAAAPNYFPQQSRVDRERTVDQESGRIIFNGANDFDAAIIVFRKSVDNNSGVQLNNNFSWNKTKAADITKQKNAAFLANNIDYNSTVSVFIRKPAYDPNNSSSERMTTATACFIDAAGRRFTRRVHWTAVDCHLVCQGGAKKTWPLIRIIPDVDNNADAQTGVGTYGTRVGDAFTGAFIFENAKQDGSGDGPEWSWHALNTYRQTLLSKSDKNPQQMINLNKVYNQVLIPERIIGISFGASSELVDLYTGPRYTDAQG